MIKYLVFDFDGTSIEGSSPSWLVNRLIFERKISPITTFKIGSWGVAYKWHLPQSESWVRGQVFRAFEGKSKESVDAYLTNFYDTIIARRFRPEAGHKAQQKQHTQQHGQFFHPNPSCLPRRGSRGR